MSESLLPVKKEQMNCVISAFPNAKWDESAKLNQLVSDLSEYSKNIDITSIPDIWAAPKAFVAQLSDKVEIQVDKWRAVLAVIGLRNVKKISLKVKSIAIPKPDDEDFSSKERFLKVVSRLRDKDFESYEGGNTIYLICYNNQPIAMVWPDSIIYPVLPAENSAIDEIFWDGKNYYDPSGSSSDERPFLSPDHREILAKWLYKLDINIGKDSDDKSNKISSLLKEYIKALGFDTQNNEDHKLTLTKDDPQKLKFIEKDNSFEIFGYGSMLTQVYSTPASEDDIDLSNVRLDGLNNDKIKSAREKHYVLVVDKCIAGQWDMPESDIKCFGATDLGSVLGMNDNQKKRFLDECRSAIPGIEIWTKDDFFTKKIAFITNFPAGANPFQNSLESFCFDFGNNNIQEFIMPIQKKVLNYFKPEHLVRNIRIERKQSNGPVTVSLTLRLSGVANKQNKTVILSNTYDEENVIRRTAVPNVQIWPNFKAKNWKQYYVFTGNSKNPRMLIEPIWSDDAELFAKNINSPEETGTNEAEKIENLNFNVLAKLIDVNLRRGSEFPKSFLCKTVEEDTDGLHETIVGLVCIDENKLKKPSESEDRATCFIGVDFGTTNTVVYAAYVPDDDLPDKPQRDQMTFQDRHFSVTRLKEADKGDLRRYFFPASEQPEELEGGAKSTIRTIFHEFSLDKSSNSEIEKKSKPLVMGNIYYLEKGQNISDDDVVIDELKGNIKWDKGAADGNRMHAFLYQLCLQAMAEAVMQGASNVIWQYSWPSSFDNETKINYANFWTETLIAAMNEIADVSSGKVYTKTESQAMADYFQKGEVKNNNQDVSGLAYSKGLLTIDVGGGTTDIYICKGINGTVERLHQCSFRMAGNDIFSDYICTKYGKFNNLLTPLWDTNHRLKEKFEKLTELAIEAGKNTAVWDTFKLEFESILKYFEDDLRISMRLCSNKGQQYSELNIVMRDIAFALGGIFYYAGEIVGFLRRNSDSPLNTDYTGQGEGCLPDCFVGGNGSKLLNWAAKGNFGINRNFTLFLRDCIVNGMLDAMDEDDVNGFDVSSNIVQSPLPKHEVSMGLICGVGSDPYEEDIQKDSGSKVGVVRRSGRRRGNTTPDNDTNVSNPQKRSDDEGVVAGEKFFLNGFKDSSDNIKITVENFTNPDKYITLDSNLEVNRFTSYYDFFEDSIEERHLFDHKTVDFSDDDLRGIFAKANNVLLSRRSTKPGKTVVEPIFIIELREAMKKLSSR